MEDPKVEELRIQEFHLTETNKGRLRWLWNNGRSLGKKIALTGIVVAAAPLAIPPLVVLSTFGVVFTVPFGFYFASYAVTDKLMSTLLSKPEPPPPPLLFGYANVSSDDEEEEAYKYNVEKVEEEGYEQDCSLEEEEMVEEDTCRAFEASAELDEEGNCDSGFDVGISGQLGIDENLKDMGEVIVGEFEQDGYEEDAGEYTEKEEPIPEEEILSMEEERGKMRGNDVEVVVVSAEVGGQNGIDVEQVEEVDVFVPRVSTEDLRPKVKFGDIEPEELERETTEMVELIRDEGSRETENIAFPMEKSFGDIKQVYVPSKKEIDDGLERLRNVGSMEGKFGDVVELGESENENLVGLEPLSNEEKAENTKLPSEKGTVAYTDKKEPVPTISSEILEGIREAEEMSPFTSGERERDIGDIKRVYVPSETERLQNDSGSVEGNFGDVEQLSNERKYENANLQHSLEKSSPFLQVSGEDINNKYNLEQLKLSSEEETVVANAALQEFSEAALTSQDTRKDDETVCTKEDIQDTGNNAMFVVPEELEPLRDIENVTDTSGEDRGEVIAVHEDLVCVKKLVVHVKKPGDNTATSIREETELKTSGKTLICIRADTRGTYTGDGLNNFLGQDNEVQDRHSQFADNHHEGIDLKSGDIQDANLHDHELPAFAGASTSKTNEGLNNEDSIWKMINVMRTIVGYEATPHASCVEELKALYIFTGVEPPASFTEPSSMGDVNEKLQFLMAIVGVKM